MEPPFTIPMAIAKLTTAPFLLDMPLLVGQVPTLFLFINSILHDGTVPSLTTYQEQL